MADASPSDADLVRAAQLGDAGALGVLLQRHQARMRAVALSVLGHRPEVEDAVQEAALTAVRHIGALREPQAWAGWLGTVVRHQARAHLRSRPPVPVPDVAAALPPLDELDPARVAERHALGDWLWHAIGQLSPQQRLVTMLRYFTDVTAYEQIAAVCGIPVGTVRSRLSVARSRLAGLLAAGAELTHGDQRELTRARRREALHALEAGRRGRYAEALAAICRPDLETIWGHGRRTYGLDYPARAMHRDVGDGVTFRLTNVVAGPDVLIWETDLLSPPDDPLHCPPSAVWVQTLRGGRIARIRIFHPRRERGPAHTAGAARS